MGKNGFIIGAIIGLGILTFTASKVTTGSPTIMVYLTFALIGGIIGSIFG